MLKKFRFVILIQRNFNEQGRHQEKIQRQAVRGPEIFGGSQGRITAMLLIFLDPQKKGGRWRPNFSQGGHGPHGAVPVNENRTINRHDYGKRDKVFNSVR